MDDLPLLLLVPAVDGLRIAALLVFFARLFLVDVVDHDEIRGLQVKMDNFFGVNLLERHDEVLRDCLDVTQVQCFVAVDQVFEEVWRPGWNAQVLGLLDLVDYLVFAIFPVGVNLSHELLFDLSPGLLVDEEVTVWGSVGAGNLRNID